MSTPHSKEKKKRFISHKAAVSWTISLSILAAFLLVFLTTMFGPLALLLALLAIIIAIGVLSRAMPEFFTALKLRKQENLADTLPSSGSMPPQPSSKRTFMMLVGVSTYNQYRITVNESPFTIGRDSASSFVLDNDMVSRTHLSITYNQDDKLCYVCDSSTNGTFLNSIKLPPKQKKALHQGDSLQIAGIVFAVEYVHY